MNDELKDNLDDKVKEIKKELWIEFGRQEKWIGRHINILLVVIALIGGGSIYTYFQIQGFIQREVQRKVTQRMDEELKKENVQKLMMASAETAVKGRVEEVILKRVDETVKPFANEIKAMTKTAKDDIGNLKDFNAMVGAANYGSRKAYYELIKISKSKSTYKENALKELIIINNELAIYKSEPNMWVDDFIIEKDGKKVPANTLSTAELFSALERPDMDRTHKTYLMRNIEGKPKSEIIKEAFRILKKSDSMPALAATCGILGDVFGEKAEFLDIENWLKFCEKELNKSSGK